MRTPIAPPLQPANGNHRPPRARVRLAAHVLVAATAASSLLAQATPSPNRFVPAHAQIVMRVAAPAVWRKDFASTRVAKLFDGPTFADARKRLPERWEGLLQQSAAAGMPRELLEAFVGDYRGEIVVAMFFDLAAAAAARTAAGAARGETPEFACVLALTPDGTFDMSKLVAALRALDENSPRPLAALQLGEHTFRAATSRRLTVTQPELVDGHLVMLVGHGLERLGPAMLEPTGRLEAELPRSALSLRVDLGSLLRPLLDLVVEAGTKSSPMAEAVAPMMQALGLRALSTFTASVRADGEHVLAETMLTANGTPIGLLGTFRLDQGRPKLLRRVPAAAAAFQVSALDLNAIRRALEAAFAAAGEHSGKLDELEAQVAEKTGVRLRADLLDHVGTELMTLGDMRSVMQTIAEQASSGDSPEPDRVLADYCVALALRDGKAFGAAVDKLLRSAGLHAARKTERYGDTDVYRLRLAGVLALEYAITEDMLLLVPGTGGDGSAHLRAVLDRLEADEPALPPELATWLDEQPAGWNSVGRTPIVELLRATFEAGEATSPRPLLRDDHARAIIEGVWNELHRLGLGDLVSVGYSTRSSLRTIHRW